MVCEFLTYTYKRKLVELASVEDLVAAGYTEKSAKHVKHTRVISTEKCDKLIRIMGQRALPVVQEALKDFIRQYVELSREAKKTLGDLLNLTN